jgi:hypothetical protein
MHNESKLSEIGTQYAEAHLAHYGEKDLRRALELYKGIIAIHPDTQEAGYSRSQVQNIVNSVVPKQELFDAQVALVSACFTRVSSTDAAPAQVAP